MEIYYGTKLAGLKGLKPFHKEESNLKEIRGIIMRSIKKDNLINNPNYPNYLLYQEKYPQYWKEAIVLQAHHLL